ncbi:GCR1-dependent translation factor 1, partial [Teratosphaeriaceae sp. CCFEE 6253]
MRLRRPSGLLLLLCAGLSLADLDSSRIGRLHKRAEDKLTQDEILQLNRIKDVPVGRGKGQVRNNDAAAAAVVVDATPSAKSTASSRPYVGTEDAPVDGLDGKPHAGPFVDRTPEST